VTQLFQIETLRCRSVGPDVCREGPSNAPATARRPIERDRPFTADIMSANAGSARSYFDQLRQHQRHPSQRVEQSAFHADILPERQSTSVAPFLDSTDCGHGQAATHFSAAASEVRIEAGRESSNPATPIVHNPLLCRVSLLTTAGRHPATERVPRRNDSSNRSVQCAPARVMRASESVRIERPLSTVTQRTR
jgi:hypothetical protein